jgi:SAM-dependent methyltransferase
VTDYDAPAAWADGPAHVYDRMAEWLVNLVPLAGHRVLDLGAGTGAASQACVATGAQPVACDLSLPMLAHRRRERPPAVCADATALPFAAASFDAVIAAFSLSHVTAIEAALTECARVLVPGGVLLASAFTLRREHPAKGLVDEVLRSAGWAPPAWYAALKGGLEERLADPSQLLDLAATAGFRTARVVVERVDTGIGSADALVRWRFGMPNCTAFLAACSPATRAGLFADAVEAVTPVAEPLRPQVAALIAR